MSVPNKRRIVIKKRAKPLAEVHSSLLHQAVKLVSKTVKIVKTFMVQRCTRKLAELKESNNDESDELDNLEKLKALDHAVYGVIIANKMLSIGKKNEDTDNGLPFLEGIMKQKKIVDLIADLEKHNNEAVAKNNDRRSIEQRRDAKQAKKAKHLLEKRSISAKDRTTAVFIDSLETTEEKSDKPVLSKKEQKEKDKTKIQKSLRNQQNRMKNKVSKQRNDSSASSSSSSFGRADRNSNNNNKPINKLKKRRADDDSGDNPEQLSKYMPAGDAFDNNKKRKYSEETSQSSYKALKVPSSDVVVASIENVKSGKDWKESGLHPSWAAKQLSKQQPLVIAATGASQGKKITFD